MQLHESSRRKREDKIHMREMQRESTVKNILRECDYEYKRLRLNSRQYPPGRSALEET